jgi:cupin 2 domain-containing protein
MKTGNLLNIAGFENSSAEIFQTLAEGSSMIERIISNGQTTPEGEWYDQPLDEWVVLLQGEATIHFEDEGLMNLYTGDYVLIDAHRKHRVVYSSSQPECIWLAIHGKFS